MGFVFNSFAYTFIFIVCHLRFIYTSFVLLASGRTMVINVEYNQLDPLLRATGHPDGDVNDKTGFSPYPGNINQVCFRPGFVFFFY